MYKEETAEDVVTCAELQELLVKAAEEQYIGNTESSAQLANVTSALLTVLVWRRAKRPIAEEELVEHEISFSAMVVMAICNTVVVNAHPHSDSLNHQGQPTERKPSVDRLPPLIEVQTPEPPTEEQTNTAIHHTHSDSSFIRQTLQEGPKSAREQTNNERNNLAPGDGTRNARCMHNLNIVINCSQWPKQIAFRPITVDLMAQSLQVQIEEFAVEPKSQIGARVASTATQPDFRSRKSRRACARACGQRVRHASAAEAPQHRHAADA